MVKPIPKSVWRVDALTVGVLFLLGAGFLVGQPRSGISIYGRIVDDVDSRPISDAGLRLTGDSLAGPVFARTMPDGKWRFRDLPFGRYQLTVEKTGYFSQSFGEADSSAVDLRMANAPEVNFGDTILTAKRAISGEVRWQNGDPGAQVTVHAYPVLHGKVALRARLVEPVRADLRGEFRLSELRPGRYVVYATATAAFVPGSNPRVAVPAFYSGGSPVEGKGSIDLRGAREHSGVSLILQEGVSVPVEGGIIPSDLLPKGSPVLLGLFARGAAQPFASAQTTVGQPFRLAAPPGSYRLAVAGRAGAKEIRAVHALDVGASPIRDLQIALAEPGYITGRIEWEAADGAQTRTIPAAGVTLFGESSDLGIFGIVRATTDSQGNFIATGAVPGETYGLSIDSMPPGAYIARLTQGSRDFPDGQWSVRSGSEGVRVVLRKDGARVEGRVNVEGRLPARAFVVLAPRNRQTETRFRTNWSRSDGAFAFAGVAPGDYDLFAFDRNDEESHLDPAFLKRFEHHSTAITLMPDVVRSVELRLIPLTPQ